MSNAELHIETMSANEEQSSTAPTAEDMKLSINELQRQVEYYKQQAIELDDRVFQMRALLQSGKGFSEVMVLDSLLHAFMSVCRERYGVINSSVLLLDDLDPEDIFYRVRACFGLPDIYEDLSGHSEEMLLFRMPHDDGLLWQVVHQGEVFSVKNLDNNPRFEIAFRKWNLEVLESDVWVPLVRGGQVLGILTLGLCDDGTRVPEAEYDFLEQIAAVASTSIDSTLKYEKNARILSNLRTLYDINQQLANVNDFKQLTIESLSTAVKALTAQKANLMLYNPDSELLEIKVVWGNIPKQTRDAINEGKMSTKSFAIGEGVAGTAAKIRKPVRVNDRTRIQQVGRNIAHCILSVPLVYGGSLMGVMTLTNKVKEKDGNLVLDTLGRFGEDDEQLLLGLADQAAVNLHKARLYTASITDRLTSLYNARHFESSLEEMINTAQVSNKPVALAVTDIDHFKKFNDTHGHQAGDYVLSETARLLKKATRKQTGDVCFRYGGEEFCMLLPDTDTVTASAVLEDFRSTVETARFEYEGKTLSVKISVGLASCPADAATRESLFEAADSALYDSKINGRNRVTRMADGQFVPVTGA